MYEEMLQSEGFTLKFLRSKSNVCLTHVVVSCLFSRVTTLAEEAQVWMPLNKNTVRNKCYLVLIITGIIHI